MEGESGRMRGWGRMRGGSPCCRFDCRIKIDKNLERGGWDHGHRWPLLMGGTQQPTKSRFQPRRRHWRRCMTTTEHVWGAFCLRLGWQTEQQKQTQLKICRGLRWPQNNIKKHNNQPKTSGIDGEEIFQDERMTGGTGEARVDHFWGEWVGLCIKNAIKSII